MSILVHESDRINVEVGSIRMQRQIEAQATNLPYHKLAVLQPFQHAEISGHIEYDIKIFGNVFRCGISP